MFAILRLLGMSIIGLDHWCKTNQANAKQRTTMRNDEFGCYIDSRGSWRDLKTNKLRFIETCEDGPDRIIVMKDEHFNVIRNITEERFQRELAAARKTGVRAIRKGCNPHATWNDCDKGIEGFRYVDVNNGRVYVVRQVNYTRFYIDLETREVIDFTDEFKKNHKITEWDINNLNKAKQKNLFPKGKMGVNVYIG